MWNRLNELFRFMDKGNEVRGIGSFNGGLFKENLKNLEIRDFIEDLSFYDDCYKKWKFEEKYDEMTNLLGEYKDTLNPIYKNLLVISSFDFGSELSVNILGHIFENSIGDIEELKDQTKERRKKDGVFYTPEYITDYICRNTIIPYLSHSGEASTVYELISEYEQENNLEELDKKLKEIKIVDPACGSGAFLNKAVDVLFEIHEALHYSMYADDSSLDQYFDSLESRRQIISDNIYGVDLNEESVEITKLSLFLKLATSSGIKKGFKLPNLDKNIKCGNSLIGDKEIVGNKAFKWKEEFKEIFDNGGFDIVVGNPPYVRVQEMPHQEIDFYSENYSFTKGHIDLSIIFIELANSIVKQKGVIGFITSNMFLTTRYGENIREYLTKYIRINKIIDFGDLNVFQDALTYVSIFIFIKDYANDFKYYQVKDIKNNFNDIEFEKIFIKDMGKDSWNLKEYKFNSIFQKIRTYPSLDSGIGKSWSGLITGRDDVFILDNVNDFDGGSEIFLPILSAKDCGRYKYSSPSQYVIYPYKWENNKTVLLSESEINSEYPKLYDYLISHKEDLKKRKDSRKTLENDSNWFKLIRQGNKKLFKNEKIVCPGESKRNKFCLDEGNSYKFARIASITSENENISLKYLLGIFNSKLIEIYLHSITPLKKGGYHSYSPSILDKVPIPYASIDFQQPIIDEVEKILELNKNFDNEISSFQKWLKRTFEIDKLPKKLENYYELDFEEFLQEVKKKKVDITQRKTQDLLEKEFNESLEIIEPLQRQIKETDDKINQLVYALYELTEEEINIIEESLK